MPCTSYYLKYNFINDNDQRGKTRHGGLWVFSFISNHKTSTCWISAQLTVFVIINSQVSGICYRNHITEISTSLLSICWVQVGFHAGCKGKSHHLPVWGRFHFNSVSQSSFPGPIASASPGKQFDVQNQTLELEPSNLFHLYYRGFCVLQLEKHCFMRCSYRPLSSNSKRLPE